MKTRIDKLGVVKVEHLHGKDYGPCDAGAHTHPKAVQHTTEGSFESALTKLSHTDTPTFLLGRDKKGTLRAVQLLDIGRTAGALEHPHGTPSTNGVVLCQVELADFSKHQPWHPDAGVVEMLAHLYSELHMSWRAPLKHVSNLDRSRSVFSSGSGWFGHSDVADQPSGHWDPGALEYETIFRRAHQLEVQPDWFVAAQAQSPLWAWMIWKDNGAPAGLRPSQIPTKVPASWWARYAVHKGL